MPKGIQHMNNPYQFPLYAAYNNTQRLSQILDKGWNKLCYICNNKLQYKIMQSDARGNKEKIYTLCNTYNTYQDIIPNIYLLLTDRKSK
jgi:hypothetical protein